MTAFGYEDPIVDTRVRVLRAEVHDGIAMSFAPLTQRSMVMVELETASGLTGRGESWVNFPAWAAAERVQTLRHGVFPVLAGQDSRRITRLHREMLRVLTPVARQWGAPGPAMQAISAIDIALWDLRGQRDGTPISWLAGGRVRDEIPVYASSLGPDGVAQQGRRCRADGYHAVKVKLGFGRDRDEAILAAAREACGADTLLYADANQAWCLSDAISMGALLRSYGVSWVEEPLRGNQLPELEEFHRSTGLDVATGENLYGVAEFWPYVVSPAIRILQPDIAKTGGLTESLSICQLALACEKRVIPHLYGGAVAFAATLQLAACMPAVAAIEYDIRDNPLRDPLLIDGPRPESGTIPIPDGPGLGIGLDPKALAHYTETPDVRSQE